MSHPLTPIEVRRDNVTRTHKKWSESKLDADWDAYCDACNSLRQWMFEHADAIVEQLQRLERIDQASRGQP